MAARGDSAARGGLQRAQGRALAGSAGCAARVVRPFRGGGGRIPARAPLSGPDAGHRGRGRRGGLRAPAARAVRPQGGVGPVSRRSPGARGRDAGEPDGDGARPLPGRDRGDGAPGRRRNRAGCQRQRLRNRDADPAGALVRLTGRVPAREPAAHAGVRRDRRRGVRSARREAVCRAASRKGGRGARPHRPRLARPSTRRARRERSRDWHPRASSRRRPNACSSRRAAGRHTPAHSAS